MKTKTLFAQVTRPAPVPVQIHSVKRSPARIFVRDLVLPALVGIYDREKGAAQRLRINLDLTVADWTPQVRDEITAVVSYEDAVNRVTALVRQGHVHLLETLAERIAADLLADSRIQSATIRLEKLDAFADCASVGVEITRGR
ncbi:dihydroneopterin aldolase [Oleisolibacter albus]|uniref:dihydroneopterin aldolase n=1 Tax=Oleisolibacter albus TaxID=2171757 RepID=UPI000DF34BC0|nr:dihydroneopterin aldolase [Oleisolibacter albus]